MSKQTAVDLYHRHIRHLIAMGLKLSEPDKTFLNSAYRDSKAMERKQMIDFAQIWEDSPIEKYDCKEDLYNETYKGDNK